MSEFSIEGLKKTQKKEQDDMAEAEKERRDAVVRERSMSRNMEMQSKKLEKERERLAKMEEEKDRRIILMKISRRFSAFPWLQEKIPDPISPKASILELKEIDELQKLELDIQGSEQRLEGYLKHGSILLEAIWGDGSTMTFLPERLRLNLKGLGGLINSPIMMEQLKPLIVETTIEYPKLGQMSLPIRWSETILRCLWTVHVMNTNPEFVKLASQPVAQFSDKNSLPNKKL